LDDLPFYRKFFGAYDFDGTLIGVGGIKSADWASDTHILYMMAVDKSHRGKGVGSDLESIRIQWMLENFPRGRCLVSTKHKKRFERWDFKTVSEVNNRHLMILEF
jgi:GNAT superfamily N-acetyltransferase